jgi:hypothetical protein
MTRKLSVSFVRFSCAFVFISTSSIEYEEHQQIVAVLSEAQVFAKEKR